MQMVRLEQSWDCTTFIVLRHQFQIGLMGERSVNVSEDEINHDKREKIKKSLVVLFENIRIRFN